MKVLVSGAAGFIGSHLAEKLAKRGDDVVGLDNFNDYYDPAKKRANEARLNAYPNFKMVEADIRDRQRMFDVFEEEQFEAVAHLAAMAGVRNAVKYPEEYVEVDLNGTQHLMDAGRANKLGNFVMASTSSVYGNTTIIPFVETDPCALGPCENGATCYREDSERFYCRCTEGFTGVTCQQASLLSHALSAALCLS